MINEPRNDAPTALYHVSDVGGIERFDPRPAPDAGSSAPAGNLVWAIDERLLHNYLLPRDCPRVTFYAGPHSDPADVDRLMAGTPARHVVAIETRWLAAVRRERLFLYRMPRESFRCTDPCAGYFVSRESIVPRAVTVVDDLLAALVARDVELRIMPSLWKLRDAVLASTLQFSILRWRNAQPRSESPERVG